jgi:hypothetical protein
MLVVPTIEINGVALAITCIIRSYIYIYIYIYMYMYKRVKLGRNFSQISAGE